MTLWAIVPVKPLRRGKSRLAATLTDDERAELNRMLLERTLRTLIDLKEVEEVLVVSRDSVGPGNWRAILEPAPSRKTALLP